VNDLFEDLQDGQNLMSLLEVLSGEHLPRERGNLRFHMLQNVQVRLVCLAWVHAYCLLLVFYGDKTSFRRLMMSYS